MLRHGWVVFHDLAVPNSGANADHLIIGPGKVFLVDSKNWRGHLARPRRDAVARTATLATIGFEAATIADVLGIPGQSVQPMMVLHGSTIPWCEQYRGGVAILPGGRLTASMLALPSVLTDQQVEGLTARALARLKPAH